MEPTAEQIAYASGVGANMARARGQFSAVEDFRQEARLALVMLLPRLAAQHPEGVTLPLLGKAIRFRLLDWLRIEYGRGDHRRKPHARAVSLEDLGVVEGATFDFADRTIDVEGDAIARTGAPLEDLIELVASMAHDPEAARVCELLAQGCTLQKIGDALGVTESRACQIVAAIRDDVRAHPNHALVRAA